VGAGEVKGADGTVGLDGVVEDRVGVILGREQVVGAPVGWGATMHAPGVYEMTSRGEKVKVVKGSAPAKVPVFSPAGEAGVRQCKNRK
jgi:hypothetical protein